MSSSILLDPPWFGTHKDSGLPVVVMAINWEGSSCLLLYADDAGYLDIEAPENIRTDWRYDMVEEEWFDAVIRAREQMADTAGGSQDG